MSDTLKAYNDDLRHPLEPLEGIDSIHLPATKEVKNKDQLITIDPNDPWSKDLDEIIEALAKLRMGYIRTLTIVRKGAGQ